MIGWASSQPAEARRSRRRPRVARRRCSSSCASITGPVHAHAQVAPAAGRHHAPEAGPEAARHRRLERQLGRAPRGARTAPARPRASAPGPHAYTSACASSSSSRSSSSVTRAVMADRAVVGGQVDVEHQLRGARPLAVAEAEQRARCCRRGESCRITSGAIPTPPPTSSARRPASRRAESRAPAARPPAPARRPAARTAGACRGRRPRAGSGPPRRCWRATERARARNGRSSSPPPQRVLGGQHRELSRCARRRRGSSTRSRR